MISQFFVKGEYGKGRICLHHGKDHILDVGQHVEFSTSTGLRDFLEQDSDQRFEFVCRRTVIDLIGTQFLTRVYNFKGMSLDTQRKRFYSEYFVPSFHTTPA